MQFPLSLVPSEQPNVGNFRLAKGFFW
ncbi:MAG: hypothetical protein QOF43_1637, partial [Gaiellaceae bacterium]|nr:hypothetical protein [Gaiellaceae bacterium]